METKKCLCAEDILEIKEKHRDITWEEFQKLSHQEKDDGTIWFITDLYNKDDALGKLTEQIKQTENILKDIKFEVLTSEEWAQLENPDPTVVYLILADEEATSFPSFGTMSITKGGFYRGQFDFQDQYEEDYEIPEGLTGIFVIDFDTPFQKEMSVDEEVGRKRFILSLDWDDTGDFEVGNYSGRLLMKDEKGVLYKYSDGNVEVVEQEVI